MENYQNLSNYGLMTHTLEVTLQVGEYKGTLRKQIGGNCFGHDILTSFDPECLDEYDIRDNDCSFRIDDDEEEGEEWFTCMLKDSKGNMLEVSDELIYLNRMIVKLEIIDCVER